MSGGGITKEGRELRAHQVLMHHRQGLSIAESARRLGIHYDSVQRWRRKLGLTNPVLNPSTARIDEEWHATVKELVAEGASSTHISQITGVHVKAVRKHYPESVWTRQQCGEVGIAASRASRMGLL